MPEKEFSEGCKGLRGQIEPGTVNIGKEAEKLRQSRVEEQKVTFSEKSTILAILWCWMHSLNKSKESDVQRIALPEDGTTVQGEFLSPVVLKQQKKNVRHVHQVLNSALASLTRISFGP